MKFMSTRGGTAVGLDDALLQGIAADGGLFVAASLPVYSPDHFAAADGIHAIAELFLQPFFAASKLRDALPEIVAETFAFPIPLTEIPGCGRSLQMLELYHGPTAAFKDVGAGFLAACLGRLHSIAEQPLTILVATSGDTGGAVAAAFNERPGTRVVVLFPDGRVSARQARQLCCWGENVLSLSVRGSFDDCQAMVKAAMADGTLSARHRFSSANSINIGRLLPQSIYYADASLRHFSRTGKKPSFVVPAGNLGNAFACILAREMGLPIGEIVLASNANRIIADFLNGAEWLPRASIRTLASAMDVGNPSNMERLRKLLGDASSLRQQLQVFSVDDDQIEDEIRRNFTEHALIVCPHTATATCAYRQLDAVQRSDQDWIVVATAHPAKFEQIVEPLIGQVVPIPDALQQILSRPMHAVTVQPDLASLAGALDDAFVP